MRRLLCALAERHIEGGEPLDVHALFAAGWPGQAIGVEAATHRVYVTLANLRKLGLDEVLLTLEEGYALDPNLKVSWIP